MAQPPKRPQLDLFGTMPPNPVATPVPAVPLVAPKAAIAAKAKRLTRALPHLDLTKASLLATRTWVKNAPDQGVTCPCCLQYAKIYKRKINSGMAASLLAIYRRSLQLMPREGWLHIPDDFKGASAVGILQSREYPKLRYWGLLQAFEGVNDNAEVPYSGKWRITEAGKAFCLEQKRVPKYVFLFDGKPLDRSDDATVSIREALGDKFNFEDLMKGQMGDKTKIKWADATANPWRGCAKVSAGCTSCYAIPQVAGLARKMGGVNPEAAAKFAGLVKDNNWTGVVRLDVNALTQPLRWQKGRRIFVNSLSDTWQENAREEWIAALFAVMAASPQHTFLLLTKRPARMLAWFTWIKEEAAKFNRSIVQACIHYAERLTGVSDEEYGINESSSIFRKLNSAHVDDPDWPLANVWLGTTTENQATANERIPLLLQTPAAVRWLSCEPMLSAIDLHRVTDGRGFHFDALSKKEGIAFEGKGCDWVICGGESGPRFRPMDLDWARGLRDQCLEAGVAYFFKQSSATKAGQGDTLDGVAWRQFPDDKDRK